MTYSWLSDAVASPLAFAQVREDPRIDVAIADRLRRSAKVIMIASGGCTAAVLSRLPHITHIKLVDANPAQLALTRLKLQLLAQAQPADRLALLGHTDMSCKERQRELTDRLNSLRLSPHVLGPLPDVARLGPDYCGRYERLFAALQSSISADAPLASSIRGLLTVGGSQRQATSPADHPTLWSRLSAIFDDIFALPNLVNLFGEEATQNPRLPFASHFALRLASVLKRQDVSRNPFVWTLLHGRGKSGVHPDWVDLPAGLPSCALEAVQSPMIDALRDAKRLGEQYDLVHLSNALDWLAPADACATLQAAWDCTARGGWVVIRQLNSTLDIRALGEAVGWEWDAALSEVLHEADRSFFYSALHIGRKC